MIVNEIFHSIQGESSYIGSPCVFVRLTGCNLRCNYCDTEYAYNDGVELSTEEIISEIKKYKCNLVEITGGEPLEQSEEVNALIMALVHSGDYTILIETNGSIDLDVIKYRTWVKTIIDFKLPSSGMSTKMYMKNFENLKEGDEVKFVIGDEDDFGVSKALIKRLNLKNVLLSPVFGKTDLPWLAEKAKELNVKFQVQLHKVVWGDDRGV